ncbi:stage III sporulation protein AF [Oscillibacter sp.]|uniref:stage III sporulation protein AF n=1 Tax=Oscillibacter sp. TaxID=1945593 RepID=UPI002615E5F3|nr:stage III sporulation protein AF [Oscillibacter sp.]MDD3346330.1 stage III sporulation protein AF [Oscillibacter sp.]
MMTAVRAWLSSVVAVTMLVSVVGIVIPEGTLRKIASFTGGLILLSALVRPVLGMDLRRLHLEMDDYRQAIETRQAELSGTEKEEMARLIETRTAAYISDEAKKRGISIAVRVTTEPDEEGIPVPVRAEITGQYSAEMAEWIASELNIPGERQAWQHGNDES